MKLITMGLLLTLTISAQTYTDFIRSSRSTSEANRLALLSQIGGDLGRYNYGGSGNHAVRKRGTFYQYWQARSGNLGVCRHIATHQQQVAHDLGFEAYAAMGISSNAIGHMYALVRTSEGWAVIDYSRIYQTDSDDPKDALELYQKTAGIPMYAHELYQEGKFQRRIITDQGWQFLSFMDYRHDNMALRTKPAVHRNVEIRLGTHEQSVRYADGELLIKAGRINGNANILEWGKQYVSTDGEEVNSLHSSLFGGTIEDEGFYGLILDTVTVAQPESGWGYAYQVSVLSCRIDSYEIMSDIRLGALASYQYGPVRPWVSIQGNGYRDEVGRDFAYGLFPEYSIGCNIRTPWCELEPYVTKREWEHEWGAAIRSQYVDILASNNGIEAAIKYDCLTLGYRHEAAYVEVGYNW